jgi:hypothetical protein
MSTQKRIDSSRANGAKSRGPVTPQGRARSRAARLTHGLTSDLIVLEYESRKDFDAMREEYFAEYQPQTRSRFDLVDQLVITRWRLNRVLVLQSVLMENQMIRQQPEIHAVYEACGPETQAGIAYQHLIDDGGALESLNRHETRLSAELRRTLKLLDSPPKTQKLHREPSDAKPPCSDEDRSDGEAPRIPSTIAHPPSTGSDRHPPSTDREAPPIPPPAPPVSCLLSPAATGQRRLIW